jgi:hypothetical protein
MRCLTSCTGLQNFLKISQSDDFTPRCSNSSFTERRERGDDITRQEGKVVTPRKQKKIGPRCWQKPKMALPTSRPFKNWILYQKKKLGYPHEILRKKLICSKKVTTLPDLTVYSTILMSMLSFNHRCMYSTAIIYTVPKAVWKIFKPRNIPSQLGNSAGSLLENCYSATSKY